MEEDVKAVSKVMDELRPLLAGQHPAVQGAAIGEALAMWLCGHPDFVREDALASLLKCVRHLMPDMEAEMFGGNGHPQNRGRTQ